MSELKPLSPEAIPAALEKAERYRFLNEPAEAESICLDILRADPENQPALIGLLLAMTDRFGKGYGVSDTQLKELLSRVKGDYERAYYNGIVAERKAKARLCQGTPGSRFYAHDGFREAMSWFEKAESVRPAGNDDAVLRWNTCSRIIEKNRLVPREEENVEPPLE
ncbi:MAG TPA: hypothetical protein VM940_14125 [Chthoniobacterales bacterium]|jgi:hypothetical protein|nr:hypothetical protein [Chthoniobacterales bacterium]